ncbi:hypothetical protein TRP66_03675 [Pseudomonas sp. JDS28PS106]|uniref:hypothetical protein n=1 Tax=Pseudomonas sp. JDS28PS106 TaxID=2497235 RepID=UPI002FD719A2
MSTQYNDPQHLPESPHSVRPRLIGGIDHQGVALDWLRHDECIHALRVPDPGRRRFSPLTGQTGAIDAPPDWTPWTAGQPRIEQLFLDCRRLLKVHGDWIVWQEPYSVSE